MKRQKSVKSMINHCVRIFNNNRDIDVIDYQNDFERIAIRRVEKQPTRAPMGFAVGDVIEQDDEDNGEYCLIRSKRK